MAKKGSEEPSVLCGRNPVVELLESDPSRVEKVFVQKGAGGEVIDRIAALARRHSVPLQRAPVERLNRLAGAVRHQGVVALAGAIAYASLEDVIARAARRAAGFPRLLYLDRVTDPRNLGAILRSALAFGVDGVLVPTSSSAPLNAAAVKTSAGAAFKVPVARLSNPVDELDGMRERGYWLIGASGDAAASVNELDWGRPVVIAMGSEGAGLGRAIRNVCDELVSIPMSPAAESLNVSVAAAILMSAAYAAVDASRV